MKWIECHECGEEYRVICDSGARPEFCPMCGTDIDYREDEDYEEDEYE